MFGTAVWFALCCAVIALVVAAILTRMILKQSTGTLAMQKISLAIRRGAMTYLKKQYKIIGIFFAAVFTILTVLAAKGFFNAFVPFIFLTGGFCSALAGIIGMNIATKANARTTAAAKESLNKGLRVAFSSGVVMGMCVVGLGLLGLCVWILFLSSFFSGLSQAEQLRQLASSILSFGMGASSVALFARVGGGIYTKAADVGADLVGKVEVGIPEDDPRNPAVIADNVGDNVGDVAGMGADLYESYVGSIIAAFALAVTSGLLFRGIAFPLLLAGSGIVASIIGTVFVRVGKGAGHTDLLKALRKGTFISSGLMAAFAFLAAKLLGLSIGLFFAVMVGLAAGIVIGLTTEYFTSSKYKPTKAISKAAETGPATVIIEGLSAGMLSTAIPIIVICAAILASFFLAGGLASLSAGLYGIGIAAVGMLSTLGIVLAIDAYGPVADNAGGIAEMSNQPSFVRDRTDAYDALGNTTAAIGKGFAIGSAGLTALSLIIAFKSEIAAAAERFGIDTALNLSITNPKIVAGLLVGGMLPFLFCSMTMKAVGRAAERIVIEVRRQFKEIKGLIAGKAEPDYERCVGISTAAAQKEMIMPSLLAIISPVLIGILIGVEATMGLLLGALISGFVLAVMMANSGGAWDNAKKYIEAGNYGGKGSAAHKAAVVGDTVGDPFKDTSGPSLNILIKLMSIVSLVFAGFIISCVLL